MRRLLFHLAMAGAAIALGWLLGTGLYLALDYFCPREVTRQLR